jgi:hypothetical protein
VVAQAVSAYAAAACGVGELERDLSQDEPGGGRGELSRCYLQRLKITSHAFALNQAWLAASLITATLLAWLKLLALDGPLAKAEPKTLRYCILHAAARLAASGRRRLLTIAPTWPWTPAIVTAWNRIGALAQAP